ncbi:tRNA (adenosine(37)-N6)-threonylcarbamoyltransferase complex transferase subunit TsaD [Malacoplasma penetrans]|uniref:tRNA N6-adenosine threonylcarbamoyltransferase n=1 Tax=Malacoplasma penetrans (strain HF-2) TaxID=272633 RepID=TSAD_MALP2|nr:tRNA (adenosine(37)-N6)-threonylcarbamoyltransferase complex transferase subunit TsaD [Malacoplasma penetrans]Q8EUQ9.2 RecName: Full=tRNA N6-adenosine threonylcarbamoyltransferase; AltName: Full=N6-L-threonylcarbamoyladenine synthase; Short=t(6)A synthase; AltName: Full=t(6)A37 threonylcarbamoyladenosine biosynthesis protein TsaD; AltName: Full=tRNA threonylcarbamoyladenosine biosynthesis protein TsaD [Malacoplasma penetrans HF-2]
MYILSIETSCDDTSVAILEDNKVLSCIIKNDSKQLNPFGGIVPEIVARYHEENIIKALDLALQESNISLNQIDKVAYTNQPGLPGSLFVGEIFAKTMAYALDVECVPINHIHGHILSPFINSVPKYPFMSLIASGKTTSIFLVKSANEIIELTKTRDDAIGEIFDKVGKALGYDYPAGPKLDKYFDISKATITPSFPPVKNDFSFSGIKNKFLSIINSSKMKNEEIDTITIGSSFLKYSIDLIIKKLKYYKDEYSVDCVCIGGGVANNNYFKQEIKKLFSDSFVPESKYSTDNAAMIGFAYYEKNK